MKRFIYIICFFLFAIVSTSQTLGIADGAMTTDGEAVKRSGMTFSKEILAQTADTIVMGLDTLEKYNQRLVRIKIDDNMPLSELDTLVSLLNKRQFTVIMALQDTIDALVQLRQFADRVNGLSGVDYKDAGCVAMWQIPLKAPSAAETVNQVKHFRNEPLVALVVDVKGMEKLEWEVMKINPDAVVLDVDPLKEGWITFESERKALPSVFLKLTAMIDNASRVAADNGIPVLINIEGFPRDNGFRKPDSDYNSRLGLWNYIKSKLDEVPQLWGVTIGQWMGKGNFTEATTSNAIYASDCSLLEQMAQ
ncbi:MAG: hypothetical protein IJS43_00840 [Bacteroidaceae bacterium]|nr:hypothetical protein [Bacteroidaceae bacterium]